MSAVTEEQSPATTSRRWDRPSDRLMVLLTGLLFTLGAVVRLRQFFSDRSLWSDEADVALNLIDRTPSGLFHPLGLGQGGPIGWLLLEKASITVFGVNETSLRLVSLVSGLLVLALGWDVARRIGGHRCALVALLLLACAPALVRYSNEVKQYETDAAASLAIIDVTLLSLKDSARQRWRAPALFSVVAAVAILCSHPATFTFVAAAVILLGTKRSYLRPDWWLAMVAPVAALAVQYLVTIKPLSDNFILKVYWKFGYPPFFASIPRRIKWAPGALARLASNPIHAHVAALLGVLLLAGIWALYRRSRAALWLFAVPFVFLLLAALDYRYPLADRLALVLVPFALIVVSAATTQPIFFGNGAANRVAAGVAVACCLVLVVPWLGSWGRLVASPQTVTELRPVLDQMQKQMQPGEPVSPYGFSAPLYAYYAAVKKLPLGSSLGLYPGGCPDNRILRRVTTSDRFWFVYSDLNSKIAPMAPKPGAVGSIQDVHAVLDRIGRYAVPQRTITGKHAGAVEFVLKPSPAAGPASQRCLGTLPPQPSV